MSVPGGLGIRILLRQPTNDPDLKSKEYAVQQTEELQRPPAPPPPRHLGPAAFVLGGVLIAAMLSLAMALGGRSVLFGSSHIRMVDEGGIELATARRAVEIGAITTITDDQLRAISQKLRDKAAEGDTRAALFVLEAAKLQRAK